VGSYPPHLQPEFQDVGDFAYLTGWRIMEVLSLQWHQVTSGTLRLEPGATKTGAGRNFPFADHPELAAVIARRAAKRDELQKCEMRIIPSVFFFHKSNRFHRAGDPLARAGSHPSSAFRMAWRAAAAKAGFAGRIPHDFRRTLRGTWSGPGFRVQ
jgi:integrase